jgi:hypothetical protein
MAESTCATVFGVHRDPNSSNFTLLSKETSYSFFSSIVTNISTENAVAFTRSSADSSIISWFITTEFNCDLATSMTFKVFTLNGLCSICMVFVFYESNAARLAILHDQFTLSHRTILTKNGPQHILVNTIRKRLNEDFDFVFIFIVNHWGVSLLFCIF